MSINAVVFDMDGVLVDSKNCMKMCWESVQIKINTSIHFDDYFSKIGKPFRTILSELGVHEDKWFAAEDTYFSAQKKFLNEIKSFEGIDDLLHILGQSYILGLVTSKNSLATRNILDKFGWNFSQVITPENCARGKPNPDPLLYFTAYEQLDPLKCVYVGDMIVDKMASELAGFKFIRAAWGYQNFAAPTANTPQDLIKMIGSM
jgi:HAD superfamily hydrolase (TIGR01549 family)